MTKSRRRLRRPMSAIKPMPISIEETWSFSEGNSMGSLEEGEIFIKKEVQTEPKSRWSI